MKQLIILNSKAKSFAYCLDYGATSNEDKVYLDLTRVDRFRPISFKRRQLQRKLIERDSSALETFHKSPLFEVICIVRCVKAFIHFKNDSEYFNVEFRHIWEVDFSTTQRFGFALFINIFL